MRCTSGIIGGVGRQLAAQRPVRVSNPEHGSEEASSVHDVRVGGWGRGRFRLRRTSGNGVKWIKGFLVLWRQASTITRHTAAIRPRIIGYRNECP